MWCAPLTHSCPTEIGKAGKRAAVYSTPSKDHYDTRRPRWNTSRNQVWGTHVGTLWNSSSWANRRWGRENTHSRNNSNYYTLKVPSQKAEIPEWVLVTSPFWLANNLEGISWRQNENKKKQVGLHWKAWEKTGKGRSNIHNSAWLA